jgi:copper transport protein
VTQRDDVTVGVARRALGSPVRLVAAALIGLLALIAADAPAAAENTPVESDPATGAVLETSPERISITFLEPLGANSTIAITCDEFYEVAPTEISDDELTMSVPIDPPLPAGACVATWSAANLRGEGNGSGQITFSIQNDTPGAANPDEPSDTGADAGTDTAATDPPVNTVITTVPQASAPTDDTVQPLSNVDSGQGPLWLGRLVSVAGIAVLFGALVLIATCWPEGVEYLITTRFIRSVWFVALGGTVLYVAAATSAVTNSSFGAGFSPAAWGDLLDAGAAGRAAIARLFLVIASGWVAFRPDRVLLPSTQLGALALPGLAVATLGFSRTDAGSLAVGASLAIVHALAMAIWLGGTITLARVVLAGSGDEDLVHAINSFGRTSMWAIGITVVSGVVQMIRLADGSLFGTSHGRVVVLKVVFVAAMVFVGISARQVAAQRLARANELSPGNADRLRRAFSTEAGIGAVTLALSAWLLALTPAAVDLTPRVDYAIEKRLRVADADFDVEVNLTRSTVGDNGLRRRRHHRRLLTNRRTAGVQPVGRVEPNARVQVVAAMNSRSGRQRRNPTPWRNRRPSSWPNETSATRPIRIGTNDRSLPAFQRLPPARRLPAASPSHSRPFAPRVTAERVVRCAVRVRRAVRLGASAENDAATPTECMLAVGVEQPEQERADPVAVLVDPVAGDGAVGGALVLHLHSARLPGW